MNPTDTIDTRRTYAVEYRGERLEFESSERSKESDATRALLGLKKWRGILANDMIITAIG